MIGTRDDKVAKLLNTRRFGSYDPEGLDWRGKYKTIILSDATATTSTRSGAAEFCGGGHGTTGSRSSARRSSASTTRKV